MLLRAVHHWHSKPDTRDAATIIMLQRPDSIAENILERYTGTSVQEFEDYILLTNFRGYVQAFAEKFSIEVHEATWVTAHAPDQGLTFLTRSSLQSQS